MESSITLERAPHVLLLPYPAQGHINPFLQLAKRLVWCGLRVTLALTRSVSSDSSRTVLDSLNIRSIKISDGFDVGGVAAAVSLDVYLDRFRVVGSITLDEAIDGLSVEESIDCLVYDPFLSWALDVAHERKVQTTAAFFTQSCTVCALYNEAHTQGSEAEMLLPIVADGVPLLGPIDAPSFLVAAGPYFAYLSLLLKQFSNINRADVVLFNTCLELETEVVKSLKKLWRTKTIGPLIPSMYLDKRMEGDTQYGINIMEQNDGRCMDWLDSKQTRSVVYISFGSIAKLRKEQVEELAWGLRNSGKNFLWVVGGLEMDDLLPRDFKRKEGEDSEELLVNWCSQLEVLAHPAISCFVTHCGWNSTMESLAFGVPMVAMPQWSDQPTNAWLVEKQWGVGVRAKVEEEGVVRRGEIELRIKEVMEGETGEEVRRNVEKYKEMAIQAVCEHGSSNEGISELVALLRSK